jgi:hypothetical protein
MSNKDLIDTLKTYGIDDYGEVKPKSRSSKQEIYGPGLKESEKAPPKPLSEEDIEKKKSIRNLHPHIYGPEYVGVPGSSSSEAQSPYEVSDGPKVEESYKFNPDFQNAFPVNGPPQPFLTDFSKFQK